MCGIAGVVGSWDDALLEQLGASLRHRGPDGGGVVDRGRCRARGAPARDPRPRDRRAADELAERALDDRLQRRDLQRPRSCARGSSATGVVFATDHSDTEVVLAALGGARRARALARAERHVRVRDPRPRAARARRSRATGSGSSRSTTRDAGGDSRSRRSCGTLLRVPGVERELDRESLFHYLTPALRSRASVRSSPGSKRLPAGHLLRYDLDSRLPAVAALVAARVRPMAPSAWASVCASALRDAVVALDARRRSDRVLALRWSRLVAP